MPEHVGAFICPTRFLHDNNTKTGLILISGSGENWVLDDIILVKPTTPRENPEKGGLFPFPR